MKVGMKYHQVPGMKMYTQCNVVPSEKGITIITG